MRFCDILGQEAVKDHLRNAVIQNKVSQAYIISGEAGAGKKALAEAFAAFLLCSEKDGKSDSCGECPSCRKLSHGNHPDVVYVTHEKTAISVDDIREQVTGTVDVRPYESEKKIYIIDEAEKMNVQAQNALLKTLENPPEYVVIILLTENAWVFLPTILSRCVRLDLKPLPERAVEEYLMKEFSLPDYMARLYAMFSQGNPGKAVAAVEDEDFRERRAKVCEMMRGIGGEPYYSVAEKVAEFAADREGLSSLLDLLSLWYRDVLLYKAVGDEGRICYSDELFTIRRDAGRLSYGRLNAICEAIGDTRTKIRANVRADLCLSELFAFLAGA